MKQNFDAIVIGGGLAGLTAATFLARGGKSIILFEKSTRAGGRAVTENEAGFQMNLGPHALYRSGEGFKILSELGIKFTGKSPSAKRSHVFYKNKLTKLPYEPFSLTGSNLFDSWRCKFELIRFFKNVEKTQTAELQNQNLKHWLDQTFQHQEVRDFVTMLLRIATYTNDAENLSAGAALSQLQMVLAKGVLYLDHGWQVLVDGLRAAAEDAGVQILTQRPVERIDRESSVRGVDLANGESYLANNVILATSATEAARLLGLPQLDLMPVKMAALTVGLNRLPFPKLLAAFGMDSPWYLSVHSAWAKLTMEKGAALIHAGKYLVPGKESHAESDRLELEQFLDICQPGWKNELVAYSYLPKMTVATAEVTAAANGFQGRPAVEVKEVAGLYLCGDWVGDRGMLCDASFASAKKAAEIILNKQDKAQKVA
ncbi:FAD-dependent oxidoreductase [bacterium]|nr:FAD-dependent oxidoreductase [bacterium]